MEFPREELLEKYVRIREEIVDPYVPDFDFTNDEIRYVRFNDAWVGLNPYRKFLLPRLVNKKNTFPKKPSNKIPKNANPDNYVTVHYDQGGKLRMVRIGENAENEVAIVYVSDQLTIGYILREHPGGKPAYNLTDFEWYEYDERGRLVGAEEYQFRGDPNDDVKINSEYYEYDGDVLSRVWWFEGFEKYPIRMTQSLVSRMMPDRIFNPNQTEYIFRRTADGFDVTRNFFFRKSQTITDELHVSEETLTHLADNGFHLV